MGIARNAKNNWEEAKRVMQSLAMSGGGVGENHHMRQLTLQKMEDNLKQAFQAVESAVIGFQTESERSRNKASAASKPSKGGESDVELTSMEMLETDPESGHRLKQLQVQEVTTDECIVHNDILDDYLKDFAKVRDDMSLLQTSMVNIAEVAASQGTMIDSIENNVVRSAEHTNMAVEQVTVSYQNQQKANRRRCIFMTICIGILLFIIIYSFIK